MQRVLHMINPVRSYSATRNEHEIHASLCTAGNNYSDATNATFDGKLSSAADTTTTDGSAANPDTEHLGNAGFGFASTLLSEL